MSKYAGEDAPSVILVLMTMPFVIGAFSIVVAEIATGITSQIRKRRDSDD